MTTEHAHYPEQTATGHDLDPNVDGDLVLSGAVNQSQTVLVAATSQDSQAWSASVEWQTGDGTTLQTESASDIALSGVTEDWARLVRKGLRVEVTFTSDVTAGTTNRLTALVDTHR